MIFQGRQFHPGTKQIFDFPFVFANLAIIVFVYVVLYII